MSKQHGQNGAVYFSTSAGGTATRRCFLSAWTLDQTSPKVDVTSFCDVNSTYVQGKRDVKGTLSGFFDSADDALFDASESVDGVNMYLYPTVNVPAQYWFGPAWLDASISVSVSGAVTVSGNFMANGAWGRVGVA